MEKFHVYQIDGGIGRCICSIPSIEKPSIIISSNPEVFDNNPNVIKNYPISNKYLWEDVIKNNIYCYPEPYHETNYFNEQIHLIQAFDKVINDKTRLGNPKLYLTETEKCEAENYLKSIRDDRPIALFQPFGAGVMFKEENPMDKVAGASDPNNPLFMSYQLMQGMGISKIYDSTYRSLDFNRATYLVNNIKKYKLLYMGNVDFNNNNVIKPKFSIRQWIAIISKVDYIVGIDSCAQHIGYCFDKPGIIMWGATSIKNLGYDTYTNYYRKDVKKEYYPYRIKNDIKINKEVMEYTEDELNEIIGVVEN